MLAIPRIEKQWCSLQASMMSFHICVNDARSGEPVTRTSIIELTYLMEYLTAME
jgi:hypothetical protein